MSHCLTFYVKSGLSLKAIGRKMCTYSQANKYLDRDNFFWLTILVK